jgi:hypothetical protein
MAASSLSISLSFLIDPGLAIARALRQAGTLAAHDSRLNVSGCFSHLPFLVVQLTGS